MVGLFFGGLVVGIMLATTVARSFLHIAFLQEQYLQRQMTLQADREGALQRRLTGKNHTIKRLRSAADRLRSMLGAQSFELGQFGSYLEREAVRAQTALNKLHTAESLARVHELNTVRFIYKEMFK